MTVTYVYDSILYNMTGQYLRSGSEEGGGNSPPWHMVVGGNIFTVTRNSQSMFSHSKWKIIN